MASYAALVSVMELLDDLLHRNRHPNLLLGRHQIIRSLHQKFILLLGLLQDYTSKGDEAADKVERRIRGAAYQALDIIESDLPEQIDSKLGLSRRNSLRPQSRWAEYVDDLEKVGREVDSIVEEVNEIKKSQAREDLQLDYVVADVGASRQTPAIGGNKMVGFENYLDAIRKELCGQSHAPQLQVIPIAGMGGIGKTFLAGNTYGDACIVDEFDFRAWVTISQDYDVIRVLQSIAKSLGITVMDDREQQGEHKGEKEESKALRGEHGGKEEAYQAPGGEREGEQEALQALSGNHGGEEDASGSLAGERKGEEKALDEREREKEAFQALDSEHEGEKEELQALDGEHVREMGGEHEGEKEEWQAVDVEHGGKEEAHQASDGAREGGKEALDDDHTREEESLDGDYAREEEALGTLDGEHKEEEEALDEHEIVINHERGKEEFQKMQGKKEMSEEDKKVMEKEKEELKKRQRKKEEREKELEERRRKKEIELKRRIHKYLSGRKYLIAIDDVWNKNVWDDLKSIFPDNRNGSRILLTTRYTNVAEHAGSPNFVLKMQFLDDDASWNLLREKVFGQNRCPRELVATGKFIASKCQGLPLAIVVIAGILYSNTTLEYWKRIERNVGSVLSEDDKTVSKILSLSYNHLPHRLKTCFLHMGSFPEDYEISISKLIRLWIAEGFLTSASTTKSLEDVGEEYLEDLVKRSLVIVTKKRANGQFKYCVIHDLLRDFCRHRGVHEYFFHDKDRVGHVDSCGAEKVRRIILDPTTPIPWAYDDGKYVHSVCWFSKTTESNIHCLDWSSTKLLRVLDVADIETLVAPFAFSRMFHLKYFALRLGTKNEKHLPPSISKFQNLQTMIIHAPRCDFIRLPSEIWKMPQLRHLIIDRMILPPVPMVSDIPLQRLDCLQTLETLQNFIFTNEATWMIPKIRKLKLSCRGEEASGIWKKYGLKNLVSLLQLEKLNIVVFCAKQFSYIDSFRNSFVFPKDLKKLSLEGCKLPWAELTVVGSLPCLQVLRLREDALVGEEWETVQGQFLKLNFLLMERLDLKQWKTDRDHFPYLERLKINKCTKLKEIPLEIGDIPTLRFIDVHSCKHAGNSANDILKDQRDMGNNVLQVLIVD